ncbi:MAG: hypothetical protein OXH79_07280 [Boseongicola sp.]|nr:hypothetical protein [Boseongicola sp.]
MNSFEEVPISGGRVKIKFQGTFWCDNKQALRDWARDKYNRCELGPPNMALSGYPYYMIFEDCESFVQFRFKFG